VRTAGLVLLGLVLITVPARRRIRRIVRGLRVFTLATTG